MNMEGDLSKNHFDSMRIISSCNSPSIYHIAAIDFLFNHLLGLVWYGFRIKPDLFFMSVINYLYNVRI
jgi:hypothetical protein